MAEEGGIYFGGGNLLQGNGAYGSATDCNGLPGLDNNREMDAGHQMQPERPHLEQDTSTVNYPTPRATQEEVIGNPGLFWKTLRELHEWLGAPLRVPVVAGQEFDLHLLYKRVCAVGGMQTVMNYKQWPEVYRPFNFPASFTSKTWTIRKIYGQLLWHYEQVYMHRNTGRKADPPLATPGPAPACRRGASRVRGRGAAAEDEESRHRKRARAAAAAAEEPSPPAAAGGGNAAWQPPQPPPPPHPRHHPPAALAAVAANNHIEAVAAAPEATAMFAAAWDTQGGSAAAAAGAAVGEGAVLPGGFLAALQADAPLPPAAAGPTSEEPAQRRRVRRVLAVRLLPGEELAAAEAGAGPAAVGLLPQAVLAGGAPWPHVPQVGALPEVQPPAPGYDDRVHQYPQQQQLHHQEQQFGAQPQVLLVPYNTSGVSQQQQHQLLQHQRQQQQQQHQQRLGTGAPPAYLLERTQPWQPPLVHPHQAQPQQHHYQQQFGVDQQGQQQCMQQQHPPQQQHEQEHTQQLQQAQQQQQLLQIMDQAAAAAAHGNDNFAQEEGGELSAGPFEHAHDGEEGEQAPEHNHVWPCEPDLEPQQQYGDGNCSAQNSLQGMDAGEGANAFNDAATCADGAVGGPLLLPQTDLLPAPAPVPQQGQQHDTMLLPLPPQPHQPEPAPQQPQRDEQDRQQPQLQVGTQRQNQAGSSLDPSLHHPMQHQPHLHHLSQRRRDQQQAQSSDHPHHQLHPAAPADACEPGPSPDDTSRPKQQPQPPQPQPPSSSRDLAGATSQSRPGARFSGTVDSAFDGGVFVTIHLCGVQYRGVLYRPPPGGTTTSGPQPLSLPLPPLPAAAAQQQQRADADSDAATPPVSGPEPLAMQPQLPHAGGAGASAAHARPDLPLVPQQQRQSTMLVAAAFGGRSSGGAGDPSRVHPALPALDGAEYRGAGDAGRGGEADAWDSAAAVWVGPGRNQYVHAGSSGGGAHASAGPQAAVPASAGAVFPPEPHAFGAGEAAVGGVAVAQERPPGLVLRNAARSFSRPGAEQQAGATWAAGGAPHGGASPPREPGHAAAARVPDPVLRPHDYSAAHDRTASSGGITPAELLGSGQAACATAAGAVLRRHSSAGGGAGAGGEEQQRARGVQPRGPFHYFSLAREAELRGQHPEWAPHEVHRRVGELWEGAAEAEKRPFEARAAEERWRYEQVNQQPGEAPAVMDREGSPSAGMGLEQMGETGGSEASGGAAGRERCGGGMCRDGGRMARVQSLPQFPQPQAGREEPQRGPPARRGMFASAGGCGPHRPPLPWGHRAMVRPPVPHGRPLDRAAPPPLPFNHADPAQSNLQQEQQPQFPFQQAMHQPFVTAQMANQQQPAGDLSEQQALRGPPDPPGPRGYVIAPPLHHLHQQRPQQQPQPQFPSQELAHPDATCVQQLPPWHLEAQYHMQPDPHAQPPPWHLEAQYHMQPDPHAQPPPQPPPQPHPQPPLFHSPEEHGGSNDCGPPIGPFNPGLAEEVHVGGHESPGQPLPYRTHPQYEALRPWEVRQVALPFTQGPGPGVPPGGRDAYEPPWQQQQQQQSGAHAERWQEGPPPVGQQYPQQPHQQHMQQQQWQQQQPQRYGLDYQAPYGADGAMAAGGGGGGRLPVDGHGGDAVAYGSEGLYGSSGGADHRLYRQDRPATAGALHAAADAEGREEEEEQPEGEQQGVYCYVQQGDGSMVRQAMQVAPEMVAQLRQLARTQGGAVALELQLPSTALPGGQLHRGGQQQHYPGQGQHHYPGQEQHQQHYYPGQEQQQEQQQQGLYQQQHHHQQEMRSWQQQQQHQQGLQDYYQERAGEVGMA